MAENKNPFKIYKLLMTLWLFAFIVVGGFIAFYPSFISEQLTVLGNLLGFSGEIPLQNNTLAWGLTVSLMVTLIWLALKSIKNPENKLVFNAIIVSKVVSTLAFICLALRFGNVWYVCAFGDGFVALTMLLVYPSNTFNIHPGFARTFINQKKYYEVWFGKIDIDENKAFWFRYTLLHGLKKEANTWAILFDKNKVITGKDSYLLEDLAPDNESIIPSVSHNWKDRFRNKKQVFHIAHNHLDEANAMGSAKEINWDLSYTDNGFGFEHVPASLKAIKLAKSTYYACHLDARFSGEIKTPEHQIKLSKHKGMIGHIYGKKSAHRWAWGHCNNFENVENVIFEGLSAQISLGGKVTPPLSSFVLIIDKKIYNFSSFIKLLKAKSKFGDGRWEFETKSKEAVLKGIAKVPENVALVEYTDTDSSNQWCYNSKMAYLKLEFTDLSSGKTQIFESHKHAAFEIVNREKPDKKVDL